MEFGGSCAEKGCGWKELLGSWLMLNVYRQEESPKQPPKDFDQGVSSAFGLAPGSVGCCQASATLSRMLLRWLQDPCLVQTAECSGKGRSQSSPGCL